jgi:hypothetical protein
MLWASGYPSPVTTVLGLVGLALFIVGMLALSAGVTWLVVRVSPNPNKSRA